jgi:DNA-binding transcriptional regulator YhcF (GntR family)
MMIKTYKHLVVAGRPPSTKVRKQVAAMLLEYARKGGNGTKNRSQREMATSLGTSYEMVNRSLQSLQEEGAIRLERQRIILKEKPLQKIAGVHGKPTSGNEATGGHKYN